MFSTHHGAMCPTCRQPAGACRCSQTNPVIGDGVIRVGRETKGRKGKGVTIVTGVPLPPEDLARLAADLKRRCGAGGTIKEGVIEIQGDHRDTIMVFLEKNGFRVKRSGG